MSIYMYMYNYIIIMYMCVSAEGSVGSFLVRLSSVESTERHYSLSVR